MPRKLGKAHHEKRDTLTWTDFSSAGFSRTENTLSESLAFSQPIEKDIQQWPERASQTQCCPPLLFLF